MKEGKEQEDVVEEEKKEEVVEDGKTRAREAGRQRTRIENAVRGGERSRGWTSRRRKEERKNR